MMRILAVAYCLWTVCAGASDFETIDLVQLRLMVPSLTGSGVMVAQPEADGPGFEVNPAVVTQPQSLFTWISSAGSATSFPNSVGAESGHADEVGKLFYGLTNGVAPGVAHVDSYDADYFYNNLIGPQTAIPARVANQSFIFPIEMASIDQAYDDYVARYGTVFVCGAGNGGPVSSPATAYNVIAVGAYGGSSSSSTVDGRSKPDITAPASFTSFSAPLVSGAAALLSQAAARNDGGAGTAVSAGDVKTIKVLLLNSATKPLGWTNGPLTPLDASYGSGVLHVGNAYRQLRGGKFSPVLTETVTVGSPHPPPLTSSNLPTRRGWDFQTLSSSVPQHGIAHYFFDLTTVTGRTITATLVWNRHQGQAAINNLDLFLYDAASGSLLASSESLVDNVEHIFVTNLPAGRYNLQVLKQGGAGRVSASETYALAFEFGPPAPPSLAGQQVVAGQFRATAVGEPNQLYAIDRTLDLLNWTPVLTNKTSAAGSFLVTEPATAAHAFFRLRDVW